MRYLAMRPLASILWAKRRIARHSLAAVRRHSKLKVGFVSISAVLLWIGIYRLARLGFWMFESFSLGALGDGVATLSLSDIVMARLLAVFALALFVMLIFSNVLVAYTTFYRSREVAFLIQSPVSSTTLFLGRFYEAVTLSSWASAFLGSPILLAYGLETGAPPIFYLSLLAFYLPFITIPAALGAIATMLLVRAFVRLRRGPWGTLAIIAGVGLFVFFRAKFQAPDFSDSNTLQAILEIMGRTQSPFLPSYWLSQGILSAASGELAEAAFHWLLLTANAVFLVWLAAGIAERFFYRGWAALRDGGGGRAGAARRGRGLLAWLEVVLRPVPQPARAMVIKDVRLFWRDTAQWSQFVVLFGILALYLANMRDMQSAPDQEAWRAWGTLLNLGATMLILASLTTRFVYPLISLEGRRFWILGLSPVSLRQVVWQKFFLSVASTSVFTIGLALFSAFQLGLDRLAILLSVAAVAATTVALSGLAVGLGSLYPSFDEDNPARVVSGMGGTLNFILSMVYVVLVASALGVVLMWGTFESHLGREALSWTIGAVLAWIAVLTAATCWIPLRLGLRHLERVEI